MTWTLCSYWLSCDTYVVRFYIHYKPTFPLLAGGKLFEYPEPSIFEERGRTVRYPCDVYILPVMSPSLRPRFRSYPILPHLGHTSQHHHETCLIHTPPSPSVNTNQYETTYNVYIFSACFRIVFHADSTCRQSTVVAPIAILKVYTPEMICSPTKRV